MGERARYRRAVHFEYAFDRLLAVKLAQAYEILHSDRVRILGAGAQMKGVSDEGRRDWFRRTGRRKSIRSPVRPRR